MLSDVIQFFVSVLLNGVYMMYCLTAIRGGLIGFGEVHFYISRDNAWARRVLRALGIFLLVTYVLDPVYKHSTGVLPPADLWCTILGILVGSFLSFSLTKRPKNLIGP